MKKVLIFITIICVIVIAVLLIINFAGDNGNEEVTSSPTDDVSADVSNTSSSSADVTDSAEPSESASPIGTQITGNVSGGSPDGEYTISVDEDRYYIVQEDGYDRFYDNTNSDEVVFLEIRYIEGAEASVLAPSFLDSYIEFTDIEYSGENKIGDTDISGETISATNGAMQLEAWLINTENGVLAVVISYTLESKDEQMGKLYAMLNTLEINQN